MVGIFVQKNIGGLMSNLKEALDQYTAIKKEREYIAEKVMALERQIERMEQSGYSVKDTVRGGEGNMHHYTIEGFPYESYSRQKTLLRVRRQQLIDRDEKLAELETQVEKFLNDVTDSRIRQMISYRYIEDMSWVQIAHRMGGNNTADGCRMAVERFLRDKQ